MPKRKRTGSGTKTQAARTLPRAEFRFIPPMAPKSIETLPPPNDRNWRDAEWIFEPKVDGYRTLLMKDGEDVVLLSRNEKDLTPMYPRIAAMGARLHADRAIVDGEIVAHDVRGQISFEALQNPKSHPGHQTTYIAFDLVHKDGRDLTALPIEERRSQLASVVGDTGVLLMIELHGSAADVMEAAITSHQEGIVAKRRNSRYTPGPDASGDWLKTKIDLQQEFVIGGFLPDGRTVAELIVGYYERSDLHFAGRVRAGFTPYQRQMLFRKLEPLRQAHSPFVDLPSGGSSHWGGGVSVDDMKVLRWVQPELVAQIAFKTWTQKHRLRLASFKRLRDDKRPQDVGREP